MAVVFDNTLVHFRSDGTLLYTTQDEIEQLRAPTATSWTPALAFGGGSTGLTYGDRSGTYYQVGKIVFYYGRILLSAVGSSTGAAVITGAPTGINVTGYGGLVAYANMSGLSAPLITCSGTGLRLRNQGAAAHTDITHANFTATSDIYFSGFYLTA